MPLVALKEFLLGSMAINYGILVVWFVAAHEWLAQLHIRFFKLSYDNFNALNYAGMAVYKIGILPWVN